MQHWIVKQDFRTVTLVIVGYISNYSDLGDAESGVPGREKPGPDANNSLLRIPADA